MYRLKFKVIPSFEFVIEKDFIVQMFRESRKNLPMIMISLILILREGWIEKKEERRGKGKKKRLRIRLEKLLTGFGCPVMLWHM